MGGFPGGAGRCRGTRMTRSWSATSRALSWTVRQAERGRFGVRDGIELQGADVEVRMNVDSCEFEYFKSTDRLNDRGHALSFITQYFDHSSCVTKSLSAD
jgi:hypothetical protein